MARLTDDKIEEIKARIQVEKDNRGMGVENYNNNWNRLFDDVVALIEYLENKK